MRWKWFPTLAEAEGKGNAACARVTTIEDPSDELDDATHQRLDPRTFRDAIWGGGEGDGSMIWGKACAIWTQWNEKWTIVLGGCEGDI